MIAPNQPTDLKDFATGDFPARHFRGKSKRVIKTYVDGLRRFQLHLAHPPTTDDLTRERYERFANWMANCGIFARVTQLDTLQRLRTLWRAALNAGLVTAGPPNPYWHAEGLPKVPKGPKPYVPRLDTLVALPGPRLRPDIPRAMVALYAMERGLGQRAFAMLHYRLTQFEKVLGRTMEFADFNDAEVNQALHSLLQLGMTPATVKGVRTGVLALWRFADEHMFVPAGPRRVRKIKLPRVRPKCWTMDELVRLVNTASRLHGVFKFRQDVRRANYWKAFVLLKYYSGLRLGDLLAVKWSDISKDGVLTVTMSKTGDVLTRPLPFECLAAIAPLKKSGLPTVLGGILNRSHIFQHFKQLVHAAGLPEGTSKWLRRSGATHLETVNPGGAMAFLGHRTPGLAHQHYIDPRIVQANSPMPPRIELTPGMR